MVSKIPTYTKEQLGPFYFDPAAIATGEVRVIDFVERIGNIEGGVNRTNNKLGVVLSAFFNQKSDRIPGEKVYRAIVNYLIQRDPVNGLLQADLLTEICAHSLRERYGSVDKQWPKNRIPTAFWETKVRLTNDPDYARSTEAPNWLKRAQQTAAHIEPCQSVREYLAAVRESFGIERRDIFHTLGLRNVTAEIIDEYEIRGPLNHYPGLPDSIANKLEELQQKGTVGKLSIPESVQQKSLFSRETYEKLKGRGRLRQTVGRDSDVRQIGHSHQVQQQRTIVAGPIKHR